LTKKFNTEAHILLKLSTSVRYKHRRRREDKNKHEHIIEKRRCDRGIRKADRLRGARLPLFRVGEGVEAQRKISQP